MGNVFFCTYEESGYPSYVFEMFPSLKYDYKFKGNYAKCIRNDVPLQGWKIHISASLSDLDEILYNVFGVLLNEKCSFKILKSIDLYKASSMKNGNRASFGKLITIYPENESECKTILETLYEKLRLFEGPYILSDKRFKDCKCLYYRYGVNIAGKVNGEIKRYFELFVDNKPTIVEDKTKPFFSLPPSIKDLYPNIIDDSYSSKLFNNYTDIESLSFSNSGGVYICTDKKNQSKCVIKEARAHTSLYSSDIDSIFFRRREADILSEFVDCDFVVNKIDSFYDWENYYLITEYVEGETLLQYAKINNPIYYSSDSKQVISFVSDILSILEKIYDSIKIMEHRNYYFYDVSPDNFMIRDSDKKVVFIDMESVSVGENNDLESILRTPQFTSFKTKSFEEHLIYSLVSVLFYLIFQKIDVLGDGIFAENIMASVVTRYPYLNPVSCMINDVLVKGIFDIDLRDRVKRVKKAINDRSINYLLPQSVKTKKILNQLHTINNVILVNDENDQPNFDKIGIFDGLLSVLYWRSIVDNDIKYEDQFLQYHKDYIANTAITNVYLGLCNGIASLPFIFTHCDNHQIREIYNSVLTIDLDDFTMDLEDGLSGIGISLIQAYANSKDISYITLLEQISDKIITTDHTSAKLGLLNGKTGIALLLLYSSMILEDERYYTIGAQLILEEYNQIKSNSYGIPMLKPTMSSIDSPYLHNGTAGVLCVLLRYYKYTSDIKYYKASRELALLFGCPISVSSGFFEGSSGIAYSLLEAAVVLSNEMLSENAYIISSDIINSLVTINKETRISNKNNYLSTSLASGVSGVGVFLHKILKASALELFPFIDNTIDQIIER